MIEYGTIILSFLFLGIISIFDIYTFQRDETIPSFVTTFIVGLFFLMGYQMFGINTLITGIFGYVVASFLLDIDLYRGESEVKILTACSFLLPSFLMIFLLSLAISIIAWGFKSYYLQFKKEQDEIPFVPAITIAYILLQIYIIL